MARNTGGTKGDVRQSALWGSGNRGGEHRSNALWGKGGRGSAVLFMAMLAFALPAGSFAKPDKGAYVPDALRAAAQANPGKQFSVIVEAVAGEGAAKADEAVKRQNGKVKRQFGVIPGVVTEINGQRLLKLASDPDVLSITLDSTVHNETYENNEMWRQSLGVDKLSSSIFGLLPPQAPAIAIVDSGVDASKLADFGTRVVAQTVICSMCAEGATGDDQGHGTMVAGLAAGSALNRAGAAPNAPIVSIRTSNEHGQSRVSDVIAAVDWIIANKAQHNIRVANFSLARADVTHPHYDPLNHAVERLWFSGVVVVTASGNHGSADGPVTIKSPGNDPFVITVGAVDQRGTVSALDDVVPAWSAHGHSVTGFAKPDVSAPGRYLIAPVPVAGTLATKLPDRVVAPGYMWMSGTSFASAIVAGAAAQLLAWRPSWSPDQVKGALMYKARALQAAGWKGGVGEVDVLGSAVVWRVPNPNRNLYQFVTGTGSDRVFDGAAWTAYVTSNQTWTSSSWSESSWSESSWSESSWTESSWSESSWSESSWTESSWNESTWSESTWSESTWSESTWSESTWVE